MEAIFNQLEGRVLLLRVRARQVDRRAHLDVHVLQRDEGGVERRPRRVRRVGVEGLLLRARLRDQAGELLRTRGEEAR